MLQTDIRPRKVAKIPAQQRSFISRVLEDLENLDVDKALKISIFELPRSAVNTVTLLHSVARQSGVSIEMHAGDEFLYVWNRILGRSR
jgi:hypothetical protein